ncbi:MAG TPA: Rieske 2Fe-2S domain-containing protein [Polyangia bacterium]|nr:Rieske 2Fe-2S domain-containing protein [Polyangia bacterium]
MKCSRREFCAAAGSGLAVLGAAACTGDSRVFTGAIDDPTQGGPPLLNDAGQPIDFASGNLPQDGGRASGDLARPQSCGGTLQAGAASAIAVGAAKHLSGGSYDLYLCRDAGGLFTVDSACTHSGCVVKLSSGHWRCPCHGARFNFDGTGPTAPAFAPLPNYAVCVDASDNVTIDLNVTVSPSQRA